MKRVALLALLISLVFASGFGLGLNWEALAAGVCSSVGQESLAGTVVTESGSETTAFAPTNGVVTPELAAPSVASEQVIPTVTVATATALASPTATGVPSRVAAAAIDDLSPRLPASARGARSAGIANDPDQAPVATTTLRSTTPTATATPPAAPAAGADRGGALAAMAARLVGSAYTWGGHSPATGFDCSGFTWYVYNQASIAIPSHDLAGQMATGQRVARESLQPGDLVFFQNTYKAGLSHAGVYIGDGRFVHAATEASGVRSDRIDDAYWRTRFLAASRP